MHNSQALNPRAEPDLLDAPCRPKAGDLGRVAAASCRRGEAGRKALAGQAPRAARDGGGAFGPVAWMLCGIAGWSLLVGGRAQIVRLAPGVAPVYAALGLNVNLRQLELQGVTSKLADEDGRTILVVEGEIRNLAEASKGAPRMLMAVLDADGREIYHWTAAPPKSRLAGGEKAAFRARLAAPPQGGREVRVRFAAAPEAGQGS
jgi:hypothetical protein